MNCRDEMLEVIRDLVTGQPDHAFRPQDVSNAMRARGSQYATSTILSCLNFQMCVNARANRFSDVERVGPGQYRLI
jgi:hypothetical protein